jgi:outer membrane protein assembly factor BamB
MPKLSGKGPPLASYSSLVISEAAGVRQYVSLIGPGIVSVDAKTGKFLWGHDKIAIQHSNIPTPLVAGDYIWGSNGYGGGTTCLKIVPDKDGPTGLKVEEQYYLKPEVCANQCGQSVIIGDYVYTGHGQYAGEPMCLEWKTGKIMWKAKQPGRGVAGLITADGMLYFRAENGEVSLIEANPTGYKLVSTFKQEDRKSPGLSHPVIAAGKLYLRDGSTRSCFDIRDPDAQKK